jgi:hypothetical protein
MEIVRLSPETSAKVVYWKVTDNANFTKYFRRSTCRTPEAALKRARKLTINELFVSGLFNHAETKVVLKG